MKETKQMKKLMIAAAAAAMIGGAYADAQFYTFSATVKTTKMAKFSGKKTYCGTPVYRTQATKKFAGAIWGCNCETIMVGNEAGWQPNEVTEEFSAALWDVTDKFPAQINDFKWRFIQRFGTDGKKVEGLFNLTGNLLTWSKNTYKKIYRKGRVGEFAFVGAGFGKVVMSNCEKSYLDYQDTFNGGLNYVSSMSGNLVGFLPAEDTVIQDCTWCKTPDAKTYDTAWELCNCCTYKKDVIGCEIAKFSDLTAASGTWSIKYNKTASKKLATKSVTALDAYKFPSYAEAYLAFVALGIIPAK